MHGDFYVMKRGWMNHPIFKKSPLTQREAWLWLIENARWQLEPCKIRIGNNVAIIQRGQLCHSIRHLSEVWGWTPSKTYRELKLLQKWSQIETANETGTLIITVCNYDEYQIPYWESETANETEMKQKRNKNETIYIDKKGKKEKKKIQKEIQVEIPDWIIPNLWTDWIAMRSEKKRPATKTIQAHNLAKLEKLKDQGYCPNRIVRRTVENGWLSFFPNDEDKLELSAQQKFSLTFPQNAHRVGNGQQGLLAEYGGKAPVPRQGTEEWKRYMRDMEGLEI